MTMTWASFESALGRHDDVAGTLDALITTAMPDVQTMLDRIGAGEAGPLLAAVHTIDARERPSKLAAGLDVMDRHLPVIDQVTKRSLISRRITWVGSAPSGDMVRSALVASLIDSELGGDPERLRGRVAMAAAALEGAFAADLNGLSKSDRGVETSAARRVLRRIIQLMLTDLQTRRTG